MMNLDQMLDTNHEKPCVWAIFYKSDGVFYKFTHDKIEAEKCEKMSYIIVGLRR